jgi:chromosome segregation ATPase
VEVTLKNTGDEAYKPHQYKNKIIIERMIRADGTGSWKIRSADKRLISTRREELNAICDHINIQVDNPMNILTQDAARKFLSASHSTDKYDVSSCEKKGGF